MNKALVLVISLVALLSLGMSATAQERLKVKGTVTKIDEAAKSLTITPKEGAPVTVTVEEPSMLSKVKEGEKGEASYEVKDGKNVAVKIRKLTEGCQ